MTEISMWCYLCEQRHLIDGPPPNLYYPYTCDECNAKLLEVLYAADEQ